MTLYQFADLIDRPLSIVRHAGGEWSVCFEDCGIEAAPGSYGYTNGRGETLNMACMKYAQEISGKRIVFGAGTSEKQTYRVPVLRHEETK